MKRLLTILGLSCMHLFAHGSPAHVTCGDDISVIQSHYSITYGDTIEAGFSTDLSLSISWSVAPQSGVSNGAGIGKTTGNLVFSQPGKYQITFLIPAHGDHPAKTETVTVEVSGVKMWFDTKNINFSKQLTTGDAFGIVMTVPVKVETYDGNAFKYTTREVQTTGAAKVTTRLKNESVLLKDGINVLSFELSGTVSQQGNIQFRIYDAKGEAIFFNYLIAN